MRKSPLKTTWHVEPGCNPEFRALILTHNGKRYVCPLVNSLNWSVMALKSLAKIS